MLRRLLLSLFAMVVVASAPQAQSGRDIIINRKAGVDLLARWVAAILQHEDGTFGEVEADIAGTLPSFQELSIDLVALRKLLREPNATVFTLPGERPKQISYSSTELAQLRALAVAANRIGGEVPLMLRAVLLHTDIAIALWTEPAPPAAANRSGTAPRLTTLLFADGQSLGSRRSANHWLIARDVLDVIPASAKREDDIRRWYRATLGMMQRADLWDPAHSAAATQRFAKDPEILFLAGCLHEALASAPIQAFVTSARLPPGSTMRVGDTREELRLARDAFATALDAAPTLIAARLRYGRVLSHLGERAAAARELRVAGWNG